MAVEHNTLHNGANAHGVVRWTVADAAALAATSVDAAAVAGRKVALQSDTGELWIATATTPTFARLLHSGAPCDAGSQNFITSGELRVGTATNRPTGGQINVAHASGKPVIAGGTNGGSTLVNLFRWHGSQTMEFGESTNVTTGTFSSSTTLNFNVGGNTALQITNKISVVLNNLQWNGVLSAPLINQDDAGAGTGSLFTIKAQTRNAAGGSTTGAKLLVAAGDGLGTGATHTGGALELRPGAGSTVGGEGFLSTGAGTKRIRWDDTGLAFYNTAPIAKQTGVAVTDAAIHAALVNLGLIAA